MLTARDEGRVIFFCGAGISRARADLPDFFRLAERVMESLGVLIDSPAQKLIATARELEPIAGVGGLISADRIFGLLEREFRIQDIQTAVASALRPKENVDLSAHRTLIDLSTGPDGKTRIVTTNFDLLFERCKKSLVRWRPPRLPHPLRDEEFVGIIHLHGVVTETYDRAAGDGFVLSSAEFGRAYLSEGWATQFIQAAMDRYDIVFVGYSADDPPVQYLLEALNRSRSGAQRKLYAFHAGSESEAKARWSHKGVHSLSYDEGDNHNGLWNTLESWAVRARNAEKWADALIREARAGPETLLPHQRGQLVHLASTVDGARKFASAKRPPPSSWLCVFDPAVRYATPSKLNLLRKDGIYFDPFENYGIDSDVVPPKIEPEDHHTKREIPPDTRDVFEPTERDRSVSNDIRLALFRGSAAHAANELPVRLRYLGAWLARTADQAACVWWAAGQKGIHPDIQAQIAFELQRSRGGRAPLARRAWRYLFESWRSKRREHGLDAYEIKQLIERDGWVDVAIRDYEWLHRPHIKISRPFWIGPKAPDDGFTDLREVMYVDVEYPYQAIAIDVPDAQVKRIIVTARQNLEFAVGLEREVGRNITHISPIEPDPDLPGKSSERDYGLSRDVLMYTGLFRRLKQLDPAAATHEYTTWRHDDAVVFARLRIWACGFAEIPSDIEVGRVLIGLSNRVFWDPYHQRDLLLVLAKRWNSLAKDVKKALERRLLAGPTRLRWQDKEQYAQYRAWTVLERVYWLRDQGCALSFDVDKKMGPYRAFMPEWKIEESKQAAASREGRGGVVRTDKSYAALLNEPLATLLKRASEKHTREHGMLLERDPFAGLVAARPVRALAGLRVGATADADAAWGWQSFLYSQSRGSDKSRLVLLIARRLTNLPTSLLGKFLNAAVSWLAQARERLCANNPEIFRTLFDKLVTTVVAEGPPPPRKSVDRDWTTEAINAPSGRLAEALLQDPSLGDRASSAALPKPWVDRAHALIATPGDGGLYALVVFAEHLDWFYRADLVWTEANLLSPLAVDGDARDAILAGFFLRPEISSFALYARLKPCLLAFASVPKTTRDRYERISLNLLLSGWRSRNEETGERLVTSEELKRSLLNGDDSLRASVLWQVAQWPEIEEKVTFLGEAWPKQMAARGPLATSGLCEITIKDPVHFVRLVEAILPLVSTIVPGSLFIHALDQEQTTIVANNPEAVLSLLWAVLPEAATNWPYSTDRVLHHIGSANESLVRDSRLIELERRWNRRQS